MVLLNLATLTLISGGPVQALSLFSVSYPDFWGLQFWVQTSMLGRLKINKLAKHRRHISWIHLAKIHFGLGARDTFMSKNVTTKTGVSDSLFRIW